MAFDYYVPDYFFNKEMLMAKREKKTAAEKYVLEMNTFWRPIELEEYHEHDTKMDRFKKTVGAIPDIESSVGQYLAKSLRDDIRTRDQKLIERMKEGTKETQLRKATD